MKKRINIMTSCDDNLAKYILPQLVAIDKNLREYDVHFFLAHSRVFPKNIKLLKNFAKEKTSITFHEAKVSKNISFYESLVSDGGPWPREAYFTLRLQDYIPDDVDRIMYIDAGDVIINGDIAPYYFGGFEGKSIIASMHDFKLNPATDEYELYNKDDLMHISKHGLLFNSGSYVINMDKFRKAGYSVSDYFRLRDALIENKKTGKLAYFGDQGFLAAAFVEDVKFFGYPQYKGSPHYMPYNFCSFYYEMNKSEPDYKPVVLHLTSPVKPWVVRFSDETISMVIDKPDFVQKRLWVVDSWAISTITGLIPQHLKLCEIWWKYAEETPIYEETDIKARITADTWIKHYLPLCTQFVDTCHQLAKLKNLEN
ncbi:MAG: hypothetical protein FWE27_01710 [Defluviitaleaceae bacterium]|nr:hypothetical protein [Defluviitaleaceae bacterium]